MHPDAADTFTVCDPKAASPPGQGQDGFGPVTLGYGCAKMDQRVAGRQPLAEPGPPASDGDLDLDHGLEPVDIRSFEEADLDELHGPRQDSNAPFRQFG